MATARLIPSTYSLSNTSYLKITNPTNLYTNTDSTTYATVTNSQTGTTSYYLYIKGFNFDDIPSNATITSFTVKLKAKESGGSTSTSYRPYLCNNTSTLTNCYSNVLSTRVQTVSFACTYDWDAIKRYGSNFGIRVNCRRSNKNTQATFDIYGAEILVEYTVPEEGPVLYIKNAESWQQVKAVYKKVNGVWAQQTNISDVFDANIKYVKA